jgi:hypothetical protein
VVAHGADDGERRAINRAKWATANASRDQAFRDAVLAAGVDPPESNLSMSDAAVKAMGLGPDQERWADGVLPRDGDQLAERGSRPAPRRY